MKPVSLSLFAALAALGLAACQQESGSTTMGEKIDHALERTQQSLTAAGEKIADSTDKAVSAVKDAAHRHDANATAQQKNAPPMANATVQSTAATAAPVPSASSSVTPGGMVTADVNAPLPKIAAATPEASPEVASQPASAPAAATSPAPATATSPARPAATSPAPAMSVASSVQSSPTLREAKRTVHDAAISASIRTDYLKDPDLSVFKIDVDTRDGVVVLNGLADTESARQRAEKIAQAVKGVREVKNYLVVKRA